MSKMSPYERLNVRPETRAKVEECIQEFLKHNPDFEGINITQDFIVLRIAKYYLDETGRGR